MNWTPLSMLQHSGLASAEQRRMPGHSRSKHLHTGPPGLQLCFQALQASLLHRVQLAEVCYALDACEHRTVNQCSLSQAVLLLAQLRSCATPSGPSVHLLEKNERPGMMSDST